MKKFLALVLTLAMMLTLCVGMIPTSAEVAASKVTITDGKATIDGVEYTAISDLTALATKGNYILSADVAVAANTVVTIAAGTKLHGNGYTISVAGNSAAAPATAAPFAVEAGEAIVISNVNFGSAAARLYLKTVAAEDGEEQADLGLFANDATPFIEVEVPVLDENDQPVLDENDQPTFKTETQLDPDAELVDVTFDGVNFFVTMSDTYHANVGGVVAYTYGDYTFENCVMDINATTGNLEVEDGAVITTGYTGGYVGFSAYPGSVTFVGSSTAVGSKIVADWRTGGLVGGASGGISLDGAVNNATVSNATLITAGLVGYVEAETVTEWKLDNCTNNGDITAFMGPKYDSDGDGTNDKAHGDAGRSAAALVGFIYKDTDNSFPPMVVNNCLNTGNILGEDRLAGLMGDNRIYGTFTKVTDADGNTLYKENGKDAQTTDIVLNAPTYNNCVNMGNVECIVKDAKSGAHVMGGLVSRAHGPMVLNNCVNFGTVNGAGQADAHLGGMIGNTSGANGATQNMATYITLTNCINYGAILNGRRLGGIVGASEAPVVFAGCVNFGYINAGETNAELAGGIAGLSDRRDHYFTGCMNFGKITGNTHAGGMTAYTRDLDQVTMTLYFEGCINFGDVTCVTAEPAGLVGYSTNDVYITECANFGNVYGLGNNSVGQFVGNVGRKLGIMNSYAFGTATDGMWPSNDGLTGFNCMINLEWAWDGEATADDFCATLIGSGATVNSHNKFVTVEQALEIVSEGELPVYALDGSLQLIYPQLRGVQTLKEAANGKTDVRFAAVVDDKDYDKVEFVYTVADGTEKTVEAVEIANVNAVNVSGATVSRDALRLSGDRLFVLVIEDVDATTTVEIEVTIQVTIGETVYEGSSTTVSIVNGVVAG